MRKIAIVGSGIAGLTLAHQLQQYADIHLYDKAKRAGGRLASRSAGPFHFDHGVQFFTVKTPEFAKFVQPLIDLGVVERWDAEFVEFSGAEAIARRQWKAEHPHYVGSPNMQAIAQTLAESLNIAFNCHITQLKQQNGKWSLFSDHAQVDEGFDWIICCVPAKQAAALLPNQFENIHIIQQTQMLACYALMLGFDVPPSLDWQAALVNDAIISWMSVNSSKPSRAGGYSMVIQANNRWAEQNLQQADHTVQQLMLEEVRRISGVDCLTASHIDLKRWVYANIPFQTGPQAFIDHNLKLAACGDWCIQGRVEAAFSSANALTKQLLPQLI